MYAVSRVKGTLMQWVADLMLFIVTVNVVMSILDLLGNLDYYSQRSLYRWLGDVLFNQIVFFPSLLIVGGARSLLLYRWRNRDRNGPSIRRYAVVSMAAAMIIVVAPFGVWIVADLRLFLPRTALAALAVSFCALVSPVSR